jgi:MHS family proline/betaine transporter-like MFS transporter
VKVGLEKVLFLSWRTFSSSVSLAHADIIAQVFFPPEPEGEENSNLIKSFAIFGGAFLVRPIGGLMIGYVGDKHGRKTALTHSLFLMAIPTTLMGCLPVYETAGSLSIVLLVLCRLLQGISVGGQLPASLVYTVEKKPKEQWGYYGALPMVAANIGSLLGNLCGAFMRQVLTEDQLLSWGWRLPFLSGILIAGVAWFIKVHGADVHTNEGVYDHQDSEITNPVRKSFQKGNRLAILSVAMTGVLWAGGYYLSFVWMAIYMGELLEPPIEHAFWINAVALFLGVTILLPVAGMISDRTGRVKLMTVSAIALAAGGPILLIMISSGNGFVAFLSQLGLGVSLSFFGGPLCAWLVENFSPEVRLTSCALGYDLAHALAGGFAPVMATVLFTKVGDRAPGVLYIIFGCISITGIYINYCCGGNQIEETSAGAPGDLELQEKTAVDAGEEAAPTETPADKELPAIA